MIIRPKVTDDENLFFDWDETDDEEVGHEYLINFRRPLPHNSILYIHLD